MNNLNFWRKCTTCKSPIGFNAQYFACSVSTCNTKRAGMVFCEVKCWDAHLPVMRHREAFYSTKRSPVSYLEEQKILDREKDIKRKKAVNPKSSEISPGKVIIRRKNN
jgi:hypothetical protein